MSRRATASVAPPGGKDDDGYRPVAGIGGRRAGGERRQRQARDGQDAEE